MVAASSHALTPEQQALVVQYLPLARRIARDVGRGLQWADIDDLQAECALRVVRAITCYDPSRGAELLTYLWHAVSRHAWWVVERMRSRQMPPWERDPIDSDSSSNPAERVEQADRVARLLRLIELLPPVHREAVRLRYGLHGRPALRSMEQVAAYLGISREEASNRLCTARRWLRAGRTRKVATRPPNRPEPVVLDGSAPAAEPIAE
jgi:RNA polymerase sigma factor (sigma-70 family)